MFSSPLTLIPATEPNQHNVEILEKYWDWPVAGCATFADYVLKSQTDPTRRFFWVYCGEELIGFYGFSKHPDFSKFQTGTFIRQDYRGGGINQKLKFTAIAAFQHMQLPLIATILEDNTRSLKAMRKIANHNGEEFKENYRQTVSYYFDLSTVKVEPTFIDRNVFKTLCSISEELETILAAAEQAA